MDYGARDAAFIALRRPGGDGDRVVAPGAYRQCARVLPVVTRREAGATSPSSARPLGELSVGDDAADAARMNAEIERALSWLATRRSTSI